LLSLVVGFPVVFQQTPFDNNGDPPSFVIIPPEEAVVKVVAVTSAVERTGGVGLSFVHELKEKSPMHRTEILKRIFMFDRI
jgi:hypothetical protein